MRGKSQALLQWSVVVAIGLLFGLPFAVAPHTRPISTFYSEFAAFALLGVVFSLAWLLKLSSRGETGGVAVAVAAPAGLAATLFIQLGTHTLNLPMQTFLAIGYALAAAMAIQAGYWLSAESTAERVLRALACAMVLASLFSAFAAWAQALRLEPHFAGLVGIYEEQEGRRLVGNLFQANHLATVLCLGMMAVGFLLARGLVSGRTYGMVLVVLASAVFLTASRTPWLQALVICAANYLLLGHDNRAAGVGERVRLIVLAALPAIALAIATAILWQLHDMLDLRLAPLAVERLADEARQQLSPRILLWRYAWELFKEHALLGVGWGEYTINQFWAAGRFGPAVNTNSAHNLLLDLLAKTGIVGTLLVMLPLLAWALGVIRAVLRGQRRRHRIFCMSMVGILMVHALLEFPLNYAYFLMPGCVLVGMAETSTVSLFSRPMRVSLGAVAIALLATVLTLAHADYKRVEFWYDDTLAKLQGQDSTGMFGDWARFGLMSMTEPDGEFVDEKLKLYEHALAMSAQTEVIVRYIILLAIRGEDARALENVARLNALNHRTVEEQYALLLRLCDRQQGKLSGFKEKLIDLYGRPSA